MFSSVIVAAGSGTRAHLGYNKLRYLVKGKPLLLYSVMPFLSRNHEVIVVINKEDEDFFKEFLPKEVKVTFGGLTRSESVKNGLALVTNTFVLIHDAARVYINSQLIEMVENNLGIYDAVCLGKRVTNTIYQLKPTNTVLDRNQLFEAETPQAFKTFKIKKAYENLTDTMPDDISVYKATYPDNIGFIVHELTNSKITYLSDIKLFEKEEDNIMYKIGHSTDIHPLIAGRKLLLGGILIPFEQGLDGHSDADVLLHAIAESILGALGLGDLGKHFPDTSSETLNMDSAIIVRKCVTWMQEAGYQIANLDATIFAEKPKMAPFIEDIRKNVSILLETDISKINIKAATNEKMDAVGNGLAISATSTVLIMKG